MNVARRLNKRTTGASFTFASWPTLAEPTLTKTSLAKPTRVFVENARNHIAFCPIFVHPLFPVFEPHIFEWVIYVPRRPSTFQNVRYIIIVCVCESVAGRRLATPSQEHGLCPPLGFQQKGRLTFTKKSAKKLRNCLWAKMKKKIRWGSGRIPQKGGTKMWQHAIWSSVEKLKSTTSHFEPN